MSAYFYLLPTAYFKGHKQKCSRTEDQQGLRPPTAETGPVVTDHADRHCARSLQRLSPSAFVTEIYRYHQFLEYNLDEAPVLSHHHTILQLFPHASKSVSDQMTCLKLRTVFHSDDICCLHPQGKAWASLQASSSSALEHETTLDRLDGVQTRSRQVRSLMNTYIFT